MNLQQFKDQLQESVLEEKVEVNQRHLIDKILARYSAPHTIFRELLQNSNDANAEAIQIQFTTEKKETKSSLFSFPWSQEKQNVVSITYKNNGLAFSENDFARLRKIAEGNPDEQKIGFFGVGFYSLFSICDEPFVTSGENTMGFFWKKDMLYTKRGKLPMGAQSQWTCFFLNTREPIELPDINDFAKFIATCLAFTTNIKVVEVFFDQDRVLYFNRRGQHPRELDIPREYSYNLSSPHNLFRLESVNVSQIQLDVEINSNPQAPQTVTVFMKIATGLVNVTIPKKISDEMYRTTKKMPPQKTFVRMMLSNFEEHDSTQQTIRGSEAVFEQLVPSPDRQGHIFIGFPTHQTTGCSVQCAGHFIPTVERESIDFVDKTLRIWNVEYLFMFGLLGRVCFDSEVIKIDELLGNMKLDPESLKWFYNKLGHNLKMFFFKPSNPSPVVGRIMSDSFAKATRKHICMISHTGKLVPISNLRLPPPADMLSFIKSIDYLPEAFILICSEVIEHYKSQRILLPISKEDVLGEISTRSLALNELIDFFKWWIRTVQAGLITKNDLDILQKKLLYLKDDTPESLSFITHFSTQKAIPFDLPIPKTCLPTEISKKFIPKELESCFWNWKDLRLVEWTHFIVTVEDFSKDPKFTERVLQTISRHFSNLSQTDKSFIISTLSIRQCIVSSLGFKKPNEVYFPTVSLFDDLPKLAFENIKSFSDVFLRQLGVREHVDLQLVFDRLHGLSWDQAQLIKYLSSIQDKLTSQEWVTLKNTHMFMSAKSQLRFQAKDLYVPTEKFMALEVHVLDWKAKWKFSSDEAKFLKALGLKSKLELTELLLLINKSPVKDRHIFLNYLMEQFDFDYSNEYNPGKITIAFLPIQNSDELALPLNCFTNTSAAIMNFPILDTRFKKYAQKLGVQETPTGNEMSIRLQQNLPTLETASDIFGFLASQQGKFETKHLKYLKSLEFIPVQSKSRLIYYPPNRVYLKGDNETFFQNSFTYVSFGNPANSFLRFCGVQEQPNPLEIASSLVKNPLDFLNNGYEEYLDLLRLIAANYRSIRQHSSLYTEMKSASFLVGISSAEKEGKTVQVFSLAKASEIFLIDDTVISQLFNPLGCPIEEILEVMYGDLGSTWISRNVQISYSPVGSMRITKESAELQEVIRERAPLILYNGQQSRPEIELQIKALILLQSIQVYTFDQIGIVRKFGNAIKKQETSSCIFNHKGESIVAITPQFDYFDVANMLSKLILKQPRLNDSLLISTLISSTLQNLTRKGFPVERILNLQKLKNQPVATQISSTNNDLSVNRQRMSVSNSQSEKLVKDDSLFGEMVKNITKTLGLSDKKQGKEAEENILSSKSLESNNEPPIILPSKQQDLNHITGSWNNPENLPPQKPSKKLATPNINPSDREYLSNQLQTSINSVVSNNSENFKTHFPNDKHVNEYVSNQVIAQCNILTEQDMTLVTVINDICVFVDRTVAEEGIAIIGSQEDAVMRFSLVLKFLSHVFGIADNVPNIYWDSNGSTIAFNRGRSLFFNLRYYLGWHYKKTMNSDDPKTYHYWFLTFCHELAHNFHGPHDATHEYWMSSFAETYMGKLINALELYGIKS